MKRVLLVLTAIALVFAVAGCGSGGAGSGSGGAKYTGKDKSGNEYTLTVSPDNKYVLTVVSGGAKVKSSGDCTGPGSSVVCGTAPSQFTVSTNGTDTITGITGTIALDGGGSRIMAAGDWNVELSNPFEDQADWLKGSFVAEGNGVIDADGVINLTNTSGSSLIGIAVPDGKATSASGSKKIKIEYIAEITSGSGQLNLKDGNKDPKTGVWGTAPGGGAYPTLKNKIIDVVEINENFYTDGSTWLWFQKNTSADVFKVKIISLKLE
jgi:hypothetical protein